MTAPDLAGQMELFPLIESTGPRGTLQEQFETFHANNPWVLDALEDLTREWLKNGRERLGIGMIWEVIRYQYGRTYTTDFKANNNHRSRYVRLMIKRHPEWEDVFATRALTAP